MYATKTPEWADAFLAAVDADQVMMSDQLPPVTAPEDLAVGVRLSGPDLERKYKAMLSQPSQVESLLQAMGEEAYCEFLADESFRLP
jgi:hypothetical protein